MTLTLTVDELRALVGPNADPAALARIESLIKILAGENHTMSQALDDKLAELDTKEDAVIALLNTDASEIAALQGAVSAQTDDTAAQAKAQALIDKLTAVLPAPAPVAPDPAPDPTQTAPDGGAASPAPSGGSSAGGDGTTPAPATGTGTDASATGPAA